MRAMILAAGRGERMRPLTDHCPKPLLTAGGIPLVVRLILSLREAGIREFVLNLHHLGERIEQALGDGREFDVSIVYSKEIQRLETAGGIARALHALGDAPFLVVNGDIATDFDFAWLCARARRLAVDRLQGHCILVDNPAHHPAGDFAIADERLVEGEPGARLTYSGVAAFAPSFFAGIKAGTAARLAPLLHAGARNGTLGASRHPGFWTDVGTPARLAALDARLRAAPDPLPIHPMNEAKIER